MRGVKYLGWWLVLWILISLACNLPARKHTEPDLPVEALRQTLAAQSAKATGVQDGPNRSVTPPSGLATATPGDYPSSPPPQTPDQPIFSYYAQAGDTLPVLGKRFDVNPDEITSEQPIPQVGLIPAGQLLKIPNQAGGVAYPSAVLPDHEIINSPTSLDFDILRYVTTAGGFLSTYVETFNGEQISGVEAVRRVAIESSINPRILLTMLEFQSGWVWGQPINQTSKSYPLGFHITGQTGLYRQLVMTATHLNIGYYGWRSGTITHLSFQDNKQIRISPALNAGSVAVQYLLSLFYPQATWPEAVYGEEGVLAVYQKLFGDPWQRAATIGTLFSDDLVQPTLELPFQPGERWSLTGGPHQSWKTGSPRGALDFAPVTGEAACSVSRAWTLASAAGLVVRSERNTLALDLDGDGYEQTGWVLIYIHLADKDRLPADKRVQLDDRLGHPSCEGGTSTGTHVHIARKYNGEWIAADGPLPLVLSGWVTYAWEKNYYGELKKADKVVVASPVGPQTSIIVR